MNLQVNQVINRKYRILGALGQGGMGKVYRAEQMPLGRIVALKVMEPSAEALSTSISDPVAAKEDFRKRFFTEASSCAKLSHPNIITIHDYGVIEGDLDGDCFIAMEHLSGQTLEQHIDAHPNGLPPARALAIAVEIARGLREAHEKGVLHRDLKPANVMLIPGDEAQERVKILDFGLAKEVGHTGGDVTLSGSLVGTPLYMAPEQYLGQKPDARADLYSLGVILYECLTGKPPFDWRGIMQLMAEQMKKRPPPLKERNPACKASPALDLLVQRLLDRRPEARFQHVDALLAATRPLPESSSVSARAHEPEILETKRRYQTGRVISELPGSSVMEATDVELGRAVILKRFSCKTPREASCVSRDLAALALLRHPVHARLLDAATTKRGMREQPFGVFEHVKGTSLRGVIAAEGKLDPARALEMGIQLLQALREAHALAILHRRLIPEHVLVVSPGTRDEHIKLIGYSVSHRATEEGSEPGTHALTSDVGTSAPELFEGKRHTERTDIYAAAAILYTCLAGEIAPRLGPQGGFMPPPPLHETQQDLSPLGAELSIVLSRAMEPNPSDRFDSAKSFLTALHDLQRRSRGRTEPPASGRPSGSYTRLWAQQRVSAWVFEEDPAFNRPVVRQALDALRQNIEVIAVSPHQREEIAEMLREDKVSSPWVVVFGDLPVLLEDPLLKHFKWSGEVSRLLVSTHANAELLHKSINFAGLDHQFCLPGSKEDLLAAISAMVERSRAIREHYDGMRALLRSSLPELGEVANVTLRA